MRKTFILCLITILVLALTSCTIYLGSPPTSTPAATPTPTLSPTPSPSPTPVFDDVKAANEMAAYLNSELDGTIITVDTVNKVFLFRMTDSSFGDSIVLIAGGNATAHKLWNDLAATLAELSITIYREVPGYSLAIVNPLNTSKTLLLIKNGEILYDFA